MKTPEGPASHKGFTARIGSALNGLRGLLWVNAYEHWEMLHELRQAKDLLTLETLLRIGIDRRPLHKRVVGERWAHPTLNTLELWLLKNGAPENKAILFPLAVWCFHSYYMSPKLRPLRKNDMRESHEGIYSVYGVAARNDADESCKIYVFAPTKRGWYQDLAADIAMTYHDDIHLMNRKRGEEIPRLYPQFLAVPGSLREFLLAPEEARRNAFITYFTEMVQQECRKRELHYLGMYTDNLAADLSTIMPPLFLRIFLHTSIPSADAIPNYLWGKKPKDVFGTPQDKPFRNLVLDYWTGHLGDPE